VRTTLLRSTASALLSGTAKVLAVASTVTDTAAEYLRPERRPHVGEDGPGPVGPIVDAARNVADTVEERAEELLGAAEEVLDDTISLDADEPADTEPEAPFPSTAPPEERRLDIAATEVAPPSAHVREPESHAAELADNPADEVVRAVADLSTDELEQLYDHESTHKNRKTVLKAIERALAPPPPDRETVYST
jgi:hypothetical protein